MRFCRTVFILCFITIVLAVSCSDRSLGRAVDPPATPILSRQLGWAVIKSSYAQVLDIPRSSGVVLGYYRKSAVVPVTERKREAIDGDAVTWLKNEGGEPGWIRERRRIALRLSREGSNGHKDGDQMNFFFLWVVPVLAGAVIGYVTNAVAIKMLFRPLTEKRILGIRIPFTPGILPSQRHKLALNIGKMVSRELLTEAIVRERLRTPEFRSLIERSISGYTDGLLSSSISKVSASSSDLGKSVGSVVERFVISDAFASLVRSVIRHAFEKIGSRTLSDLFGNNSSGFPDLPSLAERLISSLSTAETEKRIAEVIESFLRTGVEEGKALATYLPASSAAGAARLSDLLYPIAVDTLMRFLNERETRADLESKGKVLLRDAIMEMNAFQRFFISAAQYDKTLNERMPAIVDNFIARIEETAKDDDTRKRFIDAIAGGVERLLSKPIDEALSTLKTDRASIARTIAGKLTSAISSPFGRPTFSRLFANFFSSLEKETIDKILRDRLGLDPFALSDMAAYSLVAYVRAECSEAVPRLVDGFLREHGSERISQLIGVDAAEKAKWDAAITEKAIILFDERVSAVIESLDVKVMVSDRIDSLDMEDVERIVLDVMADQFKWIDIFGALLGGLMGLFQSLLTIIMGR